MHTKYRGKEQRECMQIDPAQTQSSFIRKLSYDKEQESLSFDAVKTGILIRMNSIKEVQNEVF